MTLWVYSSTLSTIFCPILWKHCSIFLVSLVSPRAVDKAEGIWSLILCLINILLPSPHPEKLYSLFILNFLKCDGSLVCVYFYSLLWTLKRHLWFGISCSLFPKSFLVLFYDNSLSEEPVNHMWDHLNLFSSFLTLLQFALC